MHPRSALLTTGVAWLALTGAMVWTAATARAELASWIADAAAGESAERGWHAALAAVARLSAPILVAAAAAAWLANAAQLRRLVAPKRRVTGAPALDRGIAYRFAQWLWSQVFIVATLGCAALWMAMRADRLAALSQVSDAQRLVGVTALLANLVSWFAAMMLAFGVVEFVRGSIEHRAALRMSDAERRQESRDDGTRAKQMRRHGTRQQSDLSAAQLIIYSDDFAIALRTDGAPSIVARGRGVDGRRMIASGRRRGIALCLDMRLTDSLADLPLGASVPTSAWPELARVVAAQS